MAFVLLLLLLAVLLAFALGALYGAPYLRTHAAQAETALDLLALKPGQTVIDLGSGDGAVLAAAARRGLRGIGYEINPLLYVWSRVTTWRYREQVKIYLANYWRVPLPPADAVFVFLIGRYMDKLEAKLERELARPAQVTSYAFTFAGRSPQAERDGVVLYRFE